MIIFLAFTILIFTTCNMPDEKSESDPINTVSFSDSIAYILEGTSANPIPNLELILDYPATSNMTYDLTYSDANISGSPTITINQGNSSESISLSGVTSDINTSTLTASYNSIDVASTQIRVYADVETRDIIELNPSTQISVFLIPVLLLFF